MNKKMPKNSKKSAKKTAAKRGRAAVAEPRKAVAKLADRKPAPPALLAGGNPQIAKGDGDAPVQAYIAAMPGWKQQVGRHLDELIVSIVPEVSKAVKWNTPFYGIEGQGWFLCFYCYTKYVQLGFIRGMHLSPIPPGESKDKETRYLNIYEGEPLDQDLLIDWIRQASQLPGSIL